MIHPVDAEASPLSSLWRRKWIILVTVLVCGLVAAGITSTLPKEYETSSELLILQQGDNQTFDAVQAAQVSARTYGNIITSPNIAALVARRIDTTLSPTELSERITAEPVPETQLLQITIADSDPQRAKQLVDAYATVFVAYVRERLAPETRVSVSVADAAAVPQNPVRPKPALYVLLAMVIGFGIGVALAALRERLDFRIRSVEQIEAQFGLPVLARLPRRGRGDDEQHAFTEAFRIMRSNLQFMHHDRSLHTLSFTSAHAGEGKSTTVTHLALATASSGSRVIAVEADVKRPALQSWFFPDEPERLVPGLTSLIVGGAEVDEVVHPTHTSAVSIVPAGPPVPSLSGMLQSARGSAIVDLLAEHAPTVLFDLPPLNAGADAVTVAARTDGVILVVDFGEATRTSINDSLRQLQAVQANVLGFVVNRDRTLKTESYGYGAEELMAATYSTTSRAER